MKAFSKIFPILFIALCVAVVMMLQNKDDQLNENHEVRSRSGEIEERSNSDDNGVVERERYLVFEDRSNKHGAGCSCPAHRSNAEPAKQKMDEAPASLLVDDRFMDRMLAIAEGAAVDFPLPGGKQARGIVSSVFMGNGQVISTQGLLQAPQKGYFFFQKQLEQGKAGSYVGMVAFDEGEVAHQVEVQDDGSSRLVQKHVGKVLCHNYDVEGEGESAMYQDGEIALAPGDHPDEGSSPGYQNAVPRFESLPGATAVIYLDFDGQEGSIQGWPQVTGGAVPSQLTAAQIKEAWRHVAEDFAPFNVNVTTDLAVYLAAPENSRQRCLHSTSCPVGGGVASVGSFNWGGDVPCWVSYQNSAGYKVMSHELGHTLKLHHDGRNFTDGSKQEYYGGHGPAEMKWGPIMGNTLGANVGQWSKGEYPLASRPNEDDLAIIVGQNNNVDYRSDDHGENLAAASYLEILPDGTASQGGVIETREDFDSFRFTTTAVGTVTLTVSGAEQKSNLDILAEIVGSDGVVRSTANPDLALGPVTLTENLPAGDYFLRVSGVGRGDHLVDGYTDYGSLGYYKVSGTVLNSVPAGRYSVAENSANGTVVGTVIPNNAHGANPLTFAITSGNSSAAFQINSSSGEITVANGALIDFEAPGTHYDSPSRFEFFVSVTDATDSSLNETVRVVITVENVNETPTLAGASGMYLLEHTPVGTLLHTMVVNDPDYQETLTYAITQGNDDGYFAIDNTGKLTVASDINIAVPSSLQNLIVQVADSGTPALTATATVSLTLVSIEDSTKSLGSISQANYHNIDGAQVSDLEGSAKFPQSPDAIHSLKEFRGVSGGEKFGGAIRGYIVPPVSGAYTFWIAADDSAKLWLSTDDSPDNVELLAYCNSWTNADQWNRFASQQSVVKNLVAGRAYYVEVRYKESGGGDHASVAWQGPEITREVISGRFLAPYFINYTPSIKTPSPALSVRKDAYNGTTVGSIEVIDFNPADTHGQFTIVGGNTNGAFSIDPASGVISIGNNAALIPGTPANLEISVTDSGAPALSATKTISINVTAPPAAYASRIYKEVWNNIGGNVTADLTSHANYPNSPTTVLSYTSLDHIDSIGNNYGARIRAYVIPSVSGNYKFWITSNEQARLFKSPDENPANAEQIAWNETWTIQPSRLYRWIRYRHQQTSAEKALVAGKKYYIEVIHKKGGNGDDLQVAWTGPGMGSPTIIGGANLEVYDPNAQPTWGAGSYAFTITKNVANGAEVGTVSAVDTDSTNLLYNILSGNDSGAFSIDFKTGAITVKDQSALLAGTHSLQIGVQDDNLNQYYFFGESAITVTITVTDDSDNDRLADTWETAHFGNITSHSATGDPDSDGLDNFTEMVFGGNPLVRDAASLRSKVASLKVGNSEVMEYRYRRPKNYATLNVVYETKTSPDLQNWVNIMEGVGILKQIESTPEDSFEWVVYKFPISLHGKNFAKTEVEPAP